MPPLTTRDPETYDQWVERTRAAADADEIEAFRRDSASDVYDAGLLQEHTTLLQRAREKRRAAELTKLLQEALYRHLGELADARLYERTPLGTKYVVERFYEECLLAIEYLSNPDQTGLPPDETLARFQRAAHGFGRSALLLSGGASLGFFHMGVIKCLFEHDLLPDVLSGASMGAMVACGIASRTDAELRELFTDWSLLRTDALSRKPVTDALRDKAVYDPGSPERGHQAQQRRLHLRAGLRAQRAGGQREHLAHAHPPEAAGAQPPDHAGRHAAERRHRVQLGAWSVPARHAHGASAGRPRRPLHAERAVDRRVVQG
jgi:hypothetical protein